MTDKRAVHAVESSRGVKMNVSVRSFSSGTVHSTSPVVAIVLESSEGEFMGSIELGTMGANILGEYLRVAAEAATQTA